MSTIYMDFQDWLRTEQGWPTSNSGRLGDYCIALNKAECEIIVVEATETASDASFEVTARREFENQTEAMNTYRELCSLDITINQFVNGEY